VGLVRDTVPPFHQFYPKSWQVRAGRYRCCYTPGPLLLQLLLPNNCSRNLIREGSVIVFEPRPHLNGDRSEEHLNLVVKVLLGQLRCCGRLGGRNN
jgi:hypothetical protein